MYLFIFYLFFIFIYLFYLKVIFSHYNKQTVMSCKRHIKWSLVLQLVRIHIRSSSAESDRFWFWSVFFLFFFYFYFFFGSISASFCSASSWLVDSLWLSRPAPRCCCWRRRRRRRKRRRRKRRRRRDTTEGTIDSNIPTEARNESGALFTSFTCPLMMTVMMMMMMLHPLHSHI